MYQMSFLHLDLGRPNLCAHLQVPCSEPEERCDLLLLLQPGTVLTLGFYFLKLALRGVRLILFQPA